MIDEWRAEDYLLLEERFKAKYSHLRTIVRRLAVSRGRRCDYEEIVDETIERLWKCLVSGVEIDSLDAMALTIAGRIIVDVMRKDKRMGSAEPEIIADDPDFSDDCVDRAALLTEVQRLEPKYCDVVTLVYLQGVSVEDAAEILGCGRSTVQRRLDAALKRLRRRL